MWTSTSAASGRTVTVADEVCTRPCDSVTGTRCTRCGPPSFLRRLPGVCTFDDEDDLVEPTVIGIGPREHPDLPAVLLGVAAVHVEEVAGEEVRLLAAFGAADLHDHVAPVVRILRDQKSRSSISSRGDRLFGCGRARRG